MLGYLEVDLLGYLYIKKKKRIGANPEEGLDSSFCYYLALR